MKRKHAESFSPNPEYILFKKVYCVRETGVLVEKQPPHGFLVCDYAGLVINKFSFYLAGRLFDLNLTPQTLNHTMHPTPYAQTPKRSILRHKLSSS